MTDIASHRGGAALWPENSRLAFEQTALLPVEQIEFDVQIASDGELVIFHDTTLDRVTNGHGLLQHHTLSELKRLRINNGGGQILTLAEGLELLANTQLILRCELKPGKHLVPYPGIVEKTLNMLEEAQLLNRTVLTSFHLPTVTTVRTVSSSVADSMWLVSDQIISLTSAQDVVMLAERAGIDFVSTHHRILRQGALQALRDNGLRVGAFAVLEDDAIQWAIENCVEVITTDRPDAAIRIRNEIRQTPTVVD